MFDLQTPELPKACCRRLKPSSRPRNHAAVSPVRLAQLTGDVPASPHVLGMRAHSREAGQWRFEKFSRFGTRMGTPFLGTLYIDPTPTLDKPGGVICGCEGPL